MTNRSVFKTNLVICLLPLAIILSLYLSGSNLFSPSKTTWLQLTLYPLVLLALFKILGRNFKLPWQIYIYATVLALIGVGYAYMYPLKAKRGGLVVARLEGDELQNETRIFREQINKALDQSGRIKALSMNESFETLEEAETFLDNSQVKILISGNKKWINIYFPKKDARTLRDIGLELEIAALSNLKVHYAVQTIGLSSEPTNSTALFIANLAEGVIDQELPLIYAAGINSFWTSFSHKAYPLWFLANKYLEKSLKKAKFTRNTLNCGIKAYRKALSYLRAGDNPDLKASIINNLGVAYVVRGYMIGKKRDVIKGKKLFALALKSYEERSKLFKNYTVAGVSTDNYALIAHTKFKFANSKGKKKNKKNKSKNVDKIKKKENKKEKNKNKVRVKKNKGEGKKRKKNKGNV